MILKASQRSGGQDLAAHLMRTDENEHVEVHEVRGFVSDDLHGAFKEAYAISRGTKCKQYLFSLSLNPPETENVPVEAFEKAIGRIERELGLEGQPRAIVFHEKEARRHAHVVWSRIDGETMTARQLSFFKTRLRDISRELYLEHDWQMPRGLLNSEDRDPRNFTLEEWQQAKRTGQAPRTIKNAIQDAWAVSDGRASFEHALQEKGFWLARGDKRGFVAVDYTGEIYAIPRALGRKAREVREKLGNPAALKSVADTKREIAAAMTPAMKEHIRAARLQFKNRTATLAHNKARMVGAHQAERRALREHQQDRTKKETKTRVARLPRGLRGVWARMTGSYTRLKQKNERDHSRCQKRDQEERQRLVEKQLLQRRALQEEIKTSRNAQAKLLQSLREDVRRYITMGRADGAPAPERRRRRSRALRL